MGQAKYAADYTAEHALVQGGQVPLAPRPDPQYRYEPRRKAPGVKAVDHGKDFGGWTWGFMATTSDEPPLAVDKVRYLYEG